VTRTAIAIRTCLILLAVWTGVWAIRAVAGSMKITAERISQEVAKADFADWSQLSAPPDATVAARRSQQIEQIAAMIERLDFLERASYRRNRTDAQVFSKLCPPEQELFVELTVMKSINSLLGSFEALPAKQRKRFIDQGMKDMTEDSAGKSVRGMIGPVLNQLDVAGIRAFLQKADAPTKFSLAPLVEAINESIQGLRGQEFGPPRRDL
jgi:hypothetical protein